MKWQAPIIQLPLARAYILCAFNESEIFFQIHKELKSRFGLTEYETDIHSITFWESSYNLNFDKLKIISFNRLIRREELVDFRKQCLQIEMRFQKMGRPDIELDPGYLTQNSVIHTSLFDYPQNIYLYGGIFAENLMYFENNTFKANSHTGEFFKRRDVISTFNDLRIIHLSDK